MTKLVQEPVEVPTADESWHPVARMLFDSLTRSAQVVFYEPSDWALAYLMCESLSRDLQPRLLGFSEDSEGNREPYIDTAPVPGASFTSYQRALASLMATEGDRRRLSVEISRRTLTAVPTPAAPKSVADRRASRLA